MAGSMLSIPRPLISVCLCSDGQNSEAQSQALKSTRRLASPRRYLYSIGVTNAKVHDVQCQGPRLALQV